MAYDSSNVFAKILRGEIPSVKVFEDDKTLAFMDVMPQAEGHVLVIPKEPAETLDQLSDDAAALTGKYIEDEQVVAPSDQAQDDNLARSLWEQSAQLVSLPADARA